MRLIPVLPLQLQISKVSHEVIQVITEVFKCVACYSLVKVFKVGNQEVLLIV